MYINRALTQRLKKLTKVFPVIVITGARQVGKSTLLKHVYENNADYIVFDPVVDIENARQDPELFLNNHQCPMVLDEIQYAPELVAAIKRRVDKNRTPGQYILTGSQQWGVLQSLSESLAGRCVFLDLEGFALDEIAKSVEETTWLEMWLKSPEECITKKGVRLSPSCTVYEQLWRGFYPETQHLPLENVADFYTAYMRTYIERDVRIMANMNDLQLFHRFVRLTAALSAQEVNISHLGREFGLHAQTVKKWLDVLKQTFQWIEVPAFSGNIIKRLSHKPKGYFADTGLLCNMMVISSPHSLGGHPLWGAIFETAVCAEIRKMISRMSPVPNMYHWRSHGGAEVDIILERDGIYYPIEVKGKSLPSKKDTSGIQAFRNTYPHLRIGKGLVIAPTDKFLQISENDYALPWDMNRFE